MLLISTTVTAVAVLWSIYLLVQAIVDNRVLKDSGKNGPLKALSITAIVAESIRTVKLVLLLGLFVISVIDPEGTQLLLIRRITILVVILLIASGSIYGGIARRALIRLVEKEVTLLRETTYTRATELLEDDTEGEATSYRVEEIEKPDIADLPSNIKPRPTPEAE